MSDVKRTERGWPGHFICADRCMFRRNTLLECGEIRIVVSTVGRMIDIHAPGQRRHFETVGYDRHFETMAFHAAYDGTFWDADVQRQVPFMSNWSLGDPSMELEAQAMHESVVEEIASKLASGEVFAVTED